MQATTTRRNVGAQTLRLLANFLARTPRLIDDGQRSEIRQLRSDIAALRSRLHADLDRDADRHLIVATARLLSEKAERLQLLEPPARSK